MAYNDKNYFQDIVEGVKTLAVGMKTTLVDTEIDRTIS